MKIVTVTSPAEKDSIYRFRYDVNVLECGKSFPGIDHCRGTIIDEADRYGTLLAAYTAGETPVLAGSARVIIGSEAGFGELAALYRMRAAGQCFPQQCSITSRLVVQADYRCSTVLGRLAVAAYRQGASAGVRMNYIHCRAENYRLFKKMGYRSHMPPLHDPVLGLIYPMVLLLADGAHFDALSSPFRKLWKQYYSESESPVDYEECFRAALQDNVCV